MSRRLVRRSQIPGESPLTAHHTVSESDDRNSAVNSLQYSPPFFPLSAESKRKIEELYLHHDFTKYKKSIKDATNLITKAAYECNDRLWLKKQKLQALEDRLNATEISDEKIRVRYETAKEYTHDLDRKVNAITVKSEKAMRDLLDFGAELSANTSILQEVAEKVGPKKSSDSTEDNRCHGENLNSDAQYSEQAVAKGIDVFRDAKESYRARYESLSLRERYADHNDYKNFKGMVHDAQNQGPNPRPLANPKYWFSGDQLPEDLSQGYQAEKDSNDDEIIMTSASANLKCSFTLQYFDEPYSNRKCKHTYEKSAILDYLRTEGVTNSQPGRRGIPQGKKQITCPTPGCSAILELEDFYLDERVRQQVIKAKKFEAAGDLVDDSDDEEPRETRLVEQNTVLNLEINGD